MATNVSKIPLIALDWDDTLFPSTSVVKEIASRSNSTLDGNEVAWLVALSDRVHIMLKCYVNTYSSRNIAIVTASKPGWVVRTLANLKSIGSWSAIFDLIFHPTHPIAVIHPQSTELPFRSRMAVVGYKQRVFMQLIEKICPPMLVSAGDSTTEFNASMQAVDASSTFCVCSRVKFVKHPSMAQMVKQIDFMIAKCGDWRPESV